MEEDNRISATATADSAGEALTSAESKARKLLRDKFPEHTGAVGTVGWVTSADGTHTATVSYSSANFPDDWDPDAVIAAANGARRKMPGKADIQRRLLRIIKPSLEERGYTFSEDKMTFSKRVGDQIHSVHLGVHRKCFSLSTRIYLDEVTEFYRAFESDPRTYRQLSTLNEVFRDFDYPDGGGEEDSPPHRSLAEAAERDIVALLVEHVIPWFDKYPSLILVKRALEQQDHNPVKHESLLPIYYLTGDRKGVEAYLGVLLSEIRTINQPKTGQFQAYYQSVRARHPAFFPALA